MSGMMQGIGASSAAARAYAAASAPDYTRAGKTGERAGEAIQDKKTQDGAQAQAAGAGAKKEVKGVNTYGSPKLSKEAEDYYHKLLQKYGNLNFVLVASDKKQEAEAMKGSFATPGRTTVLIDTDKIERMATDEKYREQIESTIRNASLGMSQMSATVGTKAGVKSYGMSYGKDGRASFFAAVDQSFAEQRKLIQKRAEKKKEAAKAEKKKAAKEADAERLEKRRADRKANGKEDGDEVIITANSIEELMRKIDEYEMGYLSDHMQTEEERMRGQSIDYSV